MGDSNHIFISYKSQERQYAYAVRDQLQSWGYETWLDVDNLPPRAEWEDDYDWQEKIDAALKSAAAVVAIVTSLAVHSRYVTAEWDIAIVQDKPLLLLVHETAPLPTRFRKLETIDLTQNGHTATFDELKLRLEKVLGSSLLKPDPFHPYLTALFDRVSVQLGQLMIKTLSTYGVEGRVAGEPIRLTVKTDENTTFEQFDDAFIACGERAVLLGEAGSGKTIMLLNAVRDAVVSRLFDAHAPLPVFASIATWDSESHVSLTDWLCQNSAMQTELKSGIESGRALLLLDGLDEIAAVTKSLATGVSDDPRLHFLNALPARNQIIVTCRAQDYASIKPHSPIRRTITLNPLSDVQTRDYLRDQPEVLAAIDSDSNLRDLLRTPLLLSFFAFTYERMTADERYRFHRLRDAGEIRETVFEQFVRRRYEHETKKRGEALPFGLAEVNRVLGQLALEDAGAPVYANRIHINSLESLLGSRTTSFIDLMKQLHLFVSIDANFFRFIHLLVRDYFAFEPALSALKDRNRYMRQSAARALKTLHDRRAIDALIAALEDHDATVRLNVVEALGEINDERIIEALIGILRGADNQVVLAAERGLAKMTQSRETVLQTIERLKKASPVNDKLKLSEKWYTLLRRSMNNPLHEKTVLWTAIFVVIACPITGVVPTLLLNNNLAGFGLTTVFYTIIFAVVIYWREKSISDTKRRKAYMSSLQRIISTLPPSVKETISWSKIKL